MTEWRRGRTTAEKKVKIILEKNLKQGEIDYRIYSFFIKHIGCAVYGDMQEIGHVEADDTGFCKDVMMLVKEINCDMCD